MRVIKYIAIHCTAGNQQESIAQLLAYFKNVRKWTVPGYHFVIKADGEIVNILPIEKVSNGVAGFNHEIINIAYLGGIDAKGKAFDNRTVQQKASLIKLLTELKKQFKTAIIKGHRDFSPDLDHDGQIESSEWIKICPCFDATKEYEKI
jgi:N-acetylmuramoyl-L-alanine amidase